MVRCWEWECRLESTAQVICLKLLLTDAILAMGNILEYRPYLDDILLLEENTLFVGFFF